MKYWKLHTIWLTAFVVSLIPACAALVATTELERTPAWQYVEFAVTACDRVEANIPEMTRVGEVMAARHIAGGMIGFAGHDYPLMRELHGRSGGIVHIGFERCWKEQRTETEMANDMAIVEVDFQPGVAVLDEMRKLKARGCYLIGFGPKHAPALTRHIELCDAFFDNGLKAGDAIEKLRGGVVVDAMNAWALIGEHVAALTRRGRMPVMAKSYTYADGQEWWSRYFQQKQFHDDFDVPPIPPGKLAKAYVGHMRGLLAKFRDSELGNVRRASELIAAQLADGRKTAVSYVGHMPGNYVARAEDALWAEGRYMWWGGKPEMHAFRRDVPDGALTLRLGYAGLHRDLFDLFREKKQRLILVAGENTHEDWRLTEEDLKDVAVYIDMGWAMGDACVPVEGYPIRLLPPSGVMQLVAYEAINAEALARCHDRGD